MYQFEGKEGRRELEWQLGRQWPGERIRKGNGDGSTKEGGEGEDKRVYIMGEKKVEEVIVSRVTDPWGLIFYANWHIVAGPMVSLASTNCGPQLWGRGRHNYYINTTYIFLTSFVAGFTFTPSQLFSVRFSSLLTFHGSGWDGGWIDSPPIPSKKIRPPLFYYIADVMTWPPFFLSPPTLLMAALDSIAFIFASNIFHSFVACIASHTSFHI